MFKYTIYLNCKHAYLKKKTHTHTHSYMFNIHNPQVNLLLVAQTLSTQQSCACFLGLTSAGVHRKLSVPVFPGIQNIPAYVEARNSLMNYVLPFSSVWSISLEDIHGTSWHTMCCWNKRNCWICLIDTVSLFWMCASLCYTNESNVYYVSNLILDEPCVTVSTHGLEETCWTPGATSLGWSESLHTGKQWTYIEVSGDVYIFPRSTDCMKCSVCFI